MPRRVAETRCGVPRRTDEATRRPDSRFRVDSANTRWRLTPRIAEYGTPAREAESPKCSRRMPSGMVNSFTRGPQPVPGLLIASFLVRA
ncbi:hypothetical protein DPMN_105737 [Dreissena polymorpha]|uniref:Uncharacterized protein n=1 Tax=Dreissena polymorpha TaxID=45954 RepID=A0A9D4K3S5_DREPO|nr:hypothetical protein DPMN_105737 [Dreissena polymorpha]